MKGVWSGVEGHSTPFFANLHVLWDVVRVPDTSLLNVGVS
jgi:hypothetical protein